MLAENRISVEAMKRSLATFSSKELKENIIPYWIRNGPDTVRGGFWGEIDNQNQPIAQAPKGLILNSRILWTFSACYKHLKDDNVLAIANRAYEYLMGRFIDTEHQGFFWSVDANGLPLDTKKQTYAQAFTIYGLSEYYSATGNPVAKDMAVSLYYLLERHCFDTTQGGYYEAFSRGWLPLDDMRLSDKDMNVAKTMNTHLHVLEAYVNLYRVWEHDDLRTSLVKLLDVLATRFVNPNDWHLNLFFDAEWNSKSDIISYGHDIEASWLMYEAAEVLGIPKLLEQFRAIALAMADASMEGLNPDGSMIYEWHRGGHGPKDEELEWWAQAEAIVGYYNAFQLTADVKYLEAADRLRVYIEEKVINRHYGEWHFRISKEGEPIPCHPIAGFWKCPYHNARMCLEIIHRTGSR